MKTGIQKNMIQGKKMRRFARRQFIAGVFFFAAAAASLNAVPVPAFDGPVNDSAQIMTADERQSLSSYLEGLNAQTGIQMAVLTIPSLDGEPLESYSMRVAEAWKLGQKGQDNGAILLVAVSEHKIRIEVGYGLEEKLTDARCGLIIRHVITPYFRTGDYGQGIEAGIQNMAGIVTGNADIVSKTVSEPEQEDSGLPLPAIVFFIIYIMLFTGVLGSRFPFFAWLPWVPFFGHGGRHHTTYYGSSGPGFFHDDHFGGGGGFGGGGASGSW